ncbi:MAG: hypothetical protein IPO63_03555 [Bacteroidetes bacterium]|nr:hypothetical protein [Bacteroidota bacterium]
MKINTYFLYLIFSLMLLPFSRGWAQLTSGIYSNGLTVAYDSTHQTITGYFEGEGGFDEQTQQPLFSCIFYFEGRITDSVASIKSYYPFKEKADTIVGIIKIKNAQTFEMKLNEEHGGCWNVSHFAEDAVEFKLEEKRNWKWISYVLHPNANIYSEPSDKKKEIHLIKKPMVVFVDAIMEGWCFIHFESTSKNEGWIKKTSLFLP